MGHLSVYFAMIYWLRYENYRFHSQYIRVINYAKHESVFARMFVLTLI